MGETEGGNKDTAFTVSNSDEQESSGIRIRFSDAKGMGRVSAISGRRKTLSHD